ncbi:MAG: leucine-rich repeat protein [Clostridia bacterium]|nr:leucine-rich repeat protein [Clostridia bacterium]
MDDMNVMQCCVCGNHHAAHFRILKRGYICDHCNTYHYYSNDNEKVRCLQGYANIRAYEFLKAEQEFQEILRDYPDSVSARWGILLARFGVVEIRGFYEKKVHEDGSRTFAVKPIYCFQHYDKWKHKTFRTEKEYTKLKELLKNEPEAWEFCEKKAAEIDKALLNFKDSKRCADRDIFICVKISKATEAHPDLKGKTEDFEEANKLYRELTARGMNVFFSFVTLQGKEILSDDQIWTNLLRSKKMLLIGSKEEYFKSAWVMSEWRRFLYLHREESLYIYSLDDDPYEILPSALAELNKFIYTPETRARLIEDICEAPVVIPPTKVMPPEPIKENPLVKNPLPPKKPRSKWLPIALVSFFLIAAATGIYAFRDNLFPSEDHGGLPMRCFLLGHDAVTDYGKAATCTEDGLTDGEHCSVCQTILTKQETISAKGHSIVTTEAKSATCAEDGFTEGGHCSVCEAVLIKPSTLAAKGHRYENGKCTVCDDIQQTEDHYFTFTLLGNGTYDIKAKDINQMPAYVKLPSSYNGKAVTSIRYRAFYGCANLQSIDIPEGVTSIGSDAFSQCAALQNVKIPDSMTNIGYGAFRKCSALQNIEISASVGIGQSAFYECEALADENGFVIVRNILFDYYGTRTDAVIPDGVTTVGYRAFYDCSELQSVAIPNSVTVIEDSAFYLCRSLQSIEIPESVTTIGTDAFIFCYGLQSIEIPKNVTSIGYGAFSSCTSLQSIVVSKDNPVYHSHGNCLIHTEKKELIAGCRNSVIPTDNSVTSIGNNAFWGIDYLEVIEIPDGVTDIGASAFWGCGDLQRIEIPESVVNIGYAVFGGCDDLQSIVVAKGNPVYHSNGNCLIHTEKKELIAGCQNSIIPSDDSVTMIAYGAFQHSDNLQSIKIPDGVTSIGDRVFDFCDRLQTVELPKSIKTIGERVFFWCDQLQTITFKGTCAEWNAVDIGSLGKDLMIQCIDGTVYYKDS